jgi:thiopeptide-type bacteriocin biosynthesis protein
MPAYRPLPGFVARAPLAPLEAFGTLTAARTWEGTAIASLAEEAIAVASPSLSAAMREPSASPRRHRRAVASALRYANRLATRPTPFGLFAGVAAGAYDDAPSLSLGDADTWRKHTRPDMKWLLSLVTALERRPDVHDRLRLYPNGAATRVGSRMVLPYTSLYGEDDDVTRRTDVSVRATPPVLRALELAGGGASGRELVAALVAASPAAGEPRVRQLVSSLVATEFLLTELRPLPNDAAPLDHVIAVLSAVPAAAAEHAALAELRDRIAAYDEAPIGDGTARLDAALAAMSDIAPEGALVQVDVAFPAAQIRVPHAVGHDLADAAQCLWRLSPRTAGMPHLRPYHQAFMERYGVDREVPLLELLGDDLGLGPPDGYDYPPPDVARAAPPAQRAEGPWGPFMERALAAQALGLRELVLTDELLDEIAPPLEDAGLPASVELFAEVACDSAAELARGAYDVVLSPVVASFGPGRAYGRFSTLLPQALRDQLEAHHRREEAETPDVLYAELAHLAPAGRLANLCMVPCLRAHEVPLGTRASGGAEPIDVADIDVYASPERLHLRSRSRGRDLLVGASNMVNVNLLPNVCRFMLEVSFEGVRLPGSIDWDPSLRLARLPRVRRGRTILAPETWYLFASVIAGELDDAAWHERFGGWRAAYGVPRFVQLVDGDRRLLLDLDSEPHRREVRRALDRHGHARLSERVGRVERGPVDGPYGGHLLEVVVPLERVGLGTAPRRSVRREVARTPAGDRLREPGTDWLYLKLYGARRRQTELIAEHVLPFAEASVAGGLADSWFYLRYGDPRPHLRLRFHGEPASLLKLLGGTAPWAARLREEGLIQHLAVDTYEREVERYGGAALMPAAERVFAADSRLCAGWLALRQEGPPVVALAALGLLDLVDRLGLDGLPPGWAAAPKLAEGAFTRDLKALAAALWLPEPPTEWGTTPAWGWAAAVAPGLLARAPALAELREAAAGMSADRVLRVLGSLAHMHCNRLMGAQDGEERAMALAAKIHRWRSTMAALGTATPPTARA